MKVFYFTTIVLLSFITTVQGQETSIKNPNAVSTNESFQKFYDSISNAPLTAGEKLVYFKASQIGCAGCVRKVENNIGAVLGVKKVKADAASKVVIIAYEASKTNVDKLKEDFKKFKYTVPTYYPNDTNVKYASFDVHANADKIKKKISSERGVKDVTVNPETKLVSVAYDSNILTTEKLISAFKKLDDSVTQEY